MIINRRDTRIIAQLYCNQNAEIEIDGMVLEEIAICNGIRQECVLSFLLSNLYTETIFEN